LNNDRAYNIGKLTAAGMNEKAAADIVDYCRNWIEQNKPDTSGVDIAAYFGLHK
jgi:hypothetical protein